MGLPFRRFFTTVRRYAHTSFPTTGVSSRFFALYGRNHRGTMPRFARIRLEQSEAWCEIRTRSSLEPSCMHTMLHASSLESCKGRAHLPSTRPYSHHMSPALETKFGPVKIKRSTGKISATIAPTGAPVLCATMVTSTHNPRIVASASRHARTQLEGAKVRQPDVGVSS